MWNEREKNINTDYAVTGWILCVIPHIREDVFKSEKNQHHIQVNDVIKTLFSGSTEKELYGTLDKFWSKYEHFNQKNDPFDSNEFIWNSKDISDGNSHLRHKKYYLPSTKVLDFVACRVSSKLFGTGSADHSLGEIKTIKSGKISALGSEISENQSIVYISVCI